MQKNTAEKHTETQFRLALCPTFTIAPQKNALESCLAQTLECSVDIHIADIDTIETEIFNANSETFKSGPDAVAILWRLEEVAPDLPYKTHSLSAEDRKRTYKNIIERINNIVKSYAHTAPLFISTIPKPQTLSASDNILHSPAEILYRLNAHIHALAAEHKNIFIFDFAGWAASVGQSFYDEKYDLFACQGIAPKEIKSFAQSLSETLAPLRRAPKKVLALDLDNTLWGGVLGEDLVSGLAIGQEHPGNVYFRIQSIAKSLKEKGVLLILLTKNNEEDVREAFETLQSQMPLALSDFISIKANWSPKSENIRKAIEELNLGIDSVVFLDDQNFECEEIRQACPEITVLEHKGEPLSMLKALREYNGFNQLIQEDEDTLRNKDYKNAAKRTELQNNVHSYEDFIRSLSLKASLAPVNQESIGRAVQMLGKTNQFNATTRRHDLATIARFNEDKSNTLITLNLGDKFGEQGIIGLAIGTKENDTTAAIDSFLLSCRALGRGAENTLWNGMLKQLKSKGYKTLNATYIPTKKNSQCSDLFKKLGMKETRSEAEGSKSYTLDLTNVTPEYSDLMTVEERFESNG